MSYIDITVPMKSGMVRYPSDPEIIISPVSEMKKGEKTNLTHFSFGSHTGTHIDPPYHVMADGKKADGLPADYFIGMARVCEFAQDISEKDVASLHPKKDDIILFKTPNSPHMLEDTFIKDYVSVTPEAAGLLVKAGVCAVGIDYLSIDKYGTLETHNILLRAGIPIIEGLNLTKAKPGVYKMTAMFMRVANSDGAPLRAILEEYER